MLTDGVSVEECWEVNAEERLEEKCEVYERDRLSVLLLNKI